MKADAASGQGPTRLRVTVIIPTFREATEIDECLATVAAQVYPPELVSVIVVDGSSDDGTAPAAERALQARRLTGSVLDNPERVTASSLNLGLARASGEIIVRLDARSRVQPHYLQTCVGILVARPEVAVVGGAQIAMPRGDSSLQAGISRALRNRWATGLSRYRRSSASGPADTVWMGVFRARDLRSVGGWDDRVALNEDYELNERLRRTGRLVWFEATLRSGYVPRGSLRLITRQHFRYGNIKGTWWARGGRPNLRQILLLVTPPILGGLLIAYGRRRGWRKPTLLFLAGLAGVEVGGGNGPGARMTGHLAAAAAIVCIGSSWWFGTVAGFVREQLRAHVTVPTLDPR